MKFKIYGALSIYHLPEYPRTVPRHFPDEIPYDAGDVRAAPAALHDLLHLIDDGGAVSVIQEDLRGLVQDDGALVLKHRHEKEDACMGIFKTVPRDLMMCKNG